ncbi:MJ0042-type zinc finger domain-containing protein, partial [Bordetella petrii]|uniref:MJ0042-type zinc finger domain-containing protein n=1 Tax=Bordetella petrii TaxID=94624 RepID=UPI001E53A4B7
MAMTTRCPHCGTAFKVVPDQLRVRNGLVRCGTCGTVFDGRACLVAQIPQGLVRPPVPGPVAPPAMPSSPVAQEPAAAA